MVKKAKSTRVEQKVRGKVMKAATYSVHGLHSDSIVPT